MSSKHKSPSGKRNSVSPPMPKKRGGGGGGGEFLN